MRSNSDDPGVPVMYTWFVTEFPALKKLENKPLTVDAALLLQQVATQKHQLALDQLAAAFFSQEKEALSKFTEAALKAAAQVNALNETFTEATIAAQEGFELALPNGAQSKTLALHEVPSFRALKGDYLDNITEGPAFRVDSLEL